MTLEPHSPRCPSLFPATFADRSDLFDHLATEQGKDDHGEGEDLSDIIDTFEMYDLTPVSGRLAVTR